MMGYIAILSPEIFLSLSSCLLLMLGAMGWLKNFKFTNVLTSLILIIAIYFVLELVPDHNISEALFNSNQLVKILHTLLLSVSICFVILYNGVKFAEISLMRSYEFQVIMLLSIVGMMLMIASSSFLSLYISLELQGLCLYAMAAFERDDSQSSEAGLKYFILGSFASALLLFGISLIYGFVGSLEFNNLAMIMLNNPSSKIAIGVIVGIIMLLIGLFFKISAAPFHMWAPDVYQGSPTIVTSFFATITKIAAVGILLKLTMFIFTGWSADLQPVYLFVTCSSVLIGALGALKQNNIKRLLAYSSIGHVGYMLMALTAFNQKFTIFAVLAYLMIYASMTLGAFAMIMNIKSNGKDITELQDLAGLSKAKPMAALALAIFMFSLAGIPPMAGFFAKFYVFQAAIASGIYVAVAFSIVAAIIAAYYYLKIVKIVYLDELKGEFTTEMGFGVKLLILLLVLFNLFYIIY